MLRSFDFEERLVPWPTEYVLYCAFVGGVQCSAALQCNVDTIAGELVDENNEEKCRPANSMFSAATLSYGAARYYCLSIEQERHCASHHGLLVVAECPVASARV